MGIALVKRHIHLNSHYRQKDSKGKGIKLFTVILKILFVRKDILSTNLKKCIC